MSNVIQLLQRYGSPLYIFNENDFVDNYNKLKNAFTAEYDNYNIGYSYKTNYTPFICKLVKDLGGLAEVVSDMELYVALKLGYDHSNIIYNGPCKGPMMQTHILNGGLCNIDNRIEAEQIVEIAKQNPDTKIKIGVRINTDIGAGFISRFGIDVYSNDIDEVVKMIKNQHNIQLVGLHMHVSRARNLSAWQKRTNNILEIADKYIDGVPEYIDLGSGMFAEMEPYLKSQFKIDIPSYADYARVVAGTIAKHYADYKQKPLLITEPGTTVVSRYLSLLSTVKAIKTVRDRRIAILDCDYHNTGETAQMMKVPYSVFKQGSNRELNAPLDLTGYTCLEQDTIYKDFPENVSVGDVIEFRNIGGYSVVYKPPFIQPNCAMISLNKNGEYSEIKRRETNEDIFATFKF